MSKSMYIQEHGFTRAEHPDQVKMHAIGFVCQYVLRGGRLIFRFAVSKGGQLTLTLMVAVGSIEYPSPSLHLLAMGMGAMTAAHFLVEWSRKRCRHGSIGIDVNHEVIFRDDPEATQGEWSEDYIQ